MAGEGAIDQVPSRQNSDRSTPSASKPEVDEVAQPPRALDQPNRDAGVADNNPTSDGRMNYGISLSGGGIRAAAFAMGVLQRMEKDEMLRGDKGAKYLSCVSGGSYMGTALTTISRGCFPEEPDDGAEAVPPSSTMPAYAPLSPEVTFLRDNTKYLTHGWGGLPVALWRLLLGIAWNFLLLIMGVLFVAIPIGWVYGALVPSLRALPPSGSVAHTDLDFPPFVFIIAGGLAVIGVILGLVWVGGLWTKAREREILAALSLGALGLAVGWLIVVVVAPITLEWIRQSFEATAQHSVNGRGSATTATAAASGTTLALSFLTALFGARALRTADSWWNQIPEAQRAKLTSRVRHQLSRSRQPILNLLALVSGPAAILAVLVFGMQIGALYPPGLGGGSDAWVPPLCYGVGVVVLVVLWLFADITAWSLHPFYRERLSNAFILKRFQAPRDKWSPTAVDDGPEHVDSRPRSYDWPLKISEAQPVDMPELVVCAAANVSRYGAAPTGASVTSFVFSESEIGGPIVGHCSAQDYEEILSSDTMWERTITAPGAMAMSGAAVSPEMGRMTRRPLRFLLTMANIRLGVWVPNPNRLREFASRAHTWRHLRLRPRVGYLLREMFGFDRPQSNFLYVTDGGHYENLGLVELVRRQCKWIWCVDASGDKQDTFSTIAGAVRLARDELGVEIEIDPTTMAPDPTVTADRARRGLKPVVQSPFCRGSIVYADGSLGTLVVIKAGVPADAPLGIAEFYKDNPAFPCDSTIHQLYTADRFDAYRELGYLCADEALVKLIDEFDKFRTEFRSKQGS